MKFTIEELEIIKESLVSSLSYLTDEVEIEDTIKLLDRIDDELDLD